MERPIDARGLAHPRATEDAMQNGIEEPVNRLAQQSGKPFLQFRLNLRECCYKLRYENVMHTITSSPKSAERSLGFACAADAWSEKTCG